jgi:quinohemoprotein ethanol dehydrogenase
MSAGRCQGNNARPDSSVHRLHDTRPMISPPASLLLATVFTSLAVSAALAQTVVDNRLLANEQDGANWASYGRTFSEQHYSPLHEIDDRNIGRLRLAWSFDLPPMASVFTAPLAVDGVLYLAPGYSFVHAIDARTGELLWRYDPEVPKHAGKRLRMGWGSRGIAYWKGKVFTATQDGRLIALDAKTGRVSWSVQTLPDDDKRYVTGPPWVFNGKVAIGFGGGDFDMVRGYVTAYDTETGRQAWRFYTVPGNPADGFEDVAMTRAAKTWKGEWWRFGGAGGTVWHAMAYDRKFNRLIIGTGNGAPWNQKIRSPGGGDNLFLCSIVALDADTGKYAWHYQVNPGETWDFNAAMDIQLADLTIKGRSRSVLLHAPKNGFFYVIDRRNGKLISAEKFAKVTWAERIDLKTGRPVEVPSARFKDGKGILMYPGMVGAHAAHAMSFSPSTGLVYLPATEFGAIYADPPGDLRQWRPKPNSVINNGIGRPNPPIELPMGSSSLLAWDPIGQRTVWSVPLTGIANGGTAATAGNLVFQGQVTGEFAAYAADSGRKLWSFDAQAGIQAQPISYLVNGRQQITVIAGWRGPSVISGMKPEWDYRLQPRRVLTFALDGAASLPPPGPRTSDILDNPDFVVDPGKAEIGQAVALTQCHLCHGAALISGGTAPDLRRSSVPLSLEALTAVLRDGALLANGMPRYEELSLAQIEGIQHFIRQRARESIAAEQAR